MRNLTRALLWILVFSIPLEQITSIALIGSITRLLGIVAAGLGILSCMVGGRFRRPDRILILASLFVAQSFSTLAWTLSYNESLQRGLTYLQLLGFVWLILEFARTREQYEPLIAAYCLGAYMTIGDLLLNRVTGRAFGQDMVAERYSAIGLDPNDLGLTLAIGIPLAWYLWLNRKGFVGLVGLCYAPLAAVGILITGSRGAALAGLIASSVIPLTFLGKSRRLLITMVVLLITLSGAAWVVPQSAFSRISTFTTEVQNLDLDGRGKIWSAGLHAFGDRPLLGVGTGAFSTAVEPMIGPRKSPHNAFLSILVEQGVVGLGCFALVILAWISLVYRLPLPERRVWFVVMMTWAVGSMSLNWEYRKNTWLLFGLAAAAHAALAGARDHAPTALRLERASRNRDQRPAALTSTPRLSRS